MRHFLLALTVALTLATPSLAQIQAGANMSGLEFNNGVQPGIGNIDYPVPDDWQAWYYSAEQVAVGEKQIMHFRLPVDWQRLVPRLLECSSIEPQCGKVELDPTYFGYITAFIGYASARGMDVVVDLHNYGRYGAHTLGDGTLTPEMLRHTWVALAQNLKGVPGVVGYDIMNEWHDIPAAVVNSAIQTTINGIRVSAGDTVTPIYVETNGWSGAPNWPNGTAVPFRDVAGKLIYEAHAYGDADNSGTHLGGTLADAGATVTTLADHMAPFIKWCRQKKAVCSIGEMAVGNSIDPLWNVELQNGLAAASAGGIQSFYYWAAGAWWGDYPSSLQPVENGNPSPNNWNVKPQLPVIQNYGQ